jgi:cytochrome b6-f complex iron-sulfur subunit
MEGICGDQVTTLDRRALLRAACAGCAALGLAACGGGSSGSPAAGAASPTAAPPGGASPSAAGSTAALAKLADIPVRGSVARRGPDGQQLLLARPTVTTVVAFSAICTHQQCIVEPAGKQFACPCHGSVYDAFTGKNISGPAPSPLRAFAVKVQGQDVVPA